MQCPLSIFRCSNDSSNVTTVTKQSSILCKSTSGSSIYSSNWTRELLCWKSFIAAVAHSSHIFILPFLFGGRTWFSSFLPLNKVGLSERRETGPRCASWWSVDLNLVPHVCFTVIALHSLFQRHQELTRQNAVRCVEVCPIKFFLGWLGGCFWVALC